MDDTVTLSRVAYDAMVLDIRKLKERISELTGKRVDEMTLGDAIASVRNGSLRNLSARARASIARASDDFAIETPVSAIYWEDIRNCGETTAYEIREALIDAKPLP